MQSFEIFEDPMMTDEQPSGVAVFNTNALQAWTKPKEQGKLIIFNTTASKAYNSGGI
jgi:hypothetical protein